MHKRSLAIGIPIGCAIWLLLGIGVHVMTTHSVQLTASLARQASRQLIQTKRVAAVLLPNLTSKYL